MSEVEVSSDSNLKKDHRIRNFLTRRWVIYVLIMFCFGIIVILLTLAGVLFSQNQQLVPTVPSDPPVSSSITNPQKLNQGFMLMSPSYSFTMSFGNDLLLFSTTTFGGTPIWQSGSTTSTISSEKEFTQTRTLNFSQNGILSIQSLSGETMWKNTNANQPVGTYFLNLLDTGRLQIIDNNGNEMWAVGQTSPQLLSTYNSSFTFPGNRFLNTNMTIENQLFRFTFNTSEGQLVTTKRSNNQTVWLNVYNPPGDLSTYSCCFTTYGNLIMFDQDRNTVWNSETCSLIQAPTSGDSTSLYNLTLNETGNMQLQYFNSNQFITYFETANNGTNKIYRTPSIAFSRSNPFALRQSSEAQIIIQSNDSSMQFIYEADGSLSLINNGKRQNTGNIRGSYLVLQGLEQISINPDLVGALSLYQMGSALPVWSLKPNPKLEVPTSQLPITLCFSIGRLTLLTQDQVVVNSTNNLI